MNKISGGTTAPAQMNWLHRYLGWLLIFSGLAMPIFAGMTGYINANRAGEFSARAVGSFLVVMGLAWAFTRSKSAKAQANGRIVSGLLLCLTVWTNLAGSVYEEAGLKASAREAIALQEEYEGKFTEFQTRFDKLPLDKVLTPSNLTTPAGIEYGRAVMAQLRALIAERQAISKSAALAADRFVGNLPTENTRRMARRQFDEGMVATVKFETNVARLQNRVADVIDAILTWSAAHQGPGMRVANGQLIFVSQADLDDYQAHMATLKVVANEEDKLTADSQAWIQKIQADRQDFRNEATKILSK